MLNEILLTILDILSLVPIVAILGTPLWIFLIIRWLNKTMLTFDEECDRMAKKLSKEEYDVWYKEAYAEEMARLAEIEKMGEWTTDDARDADAREWRAQADEQWRQWEQDCYECWTNDDY